MSQQLRSYGQLVLVVLEERLLCGNGLDDGRQEKEKRDEKKEEENCTNENAKEGVSIFINATFYSALIMDNLLVLTRLLPGK